MSPNTRVGVGWVVRKEPKKCHILFEWHPNVLLLIMLKCLAKINQIQIQFTSEHDIRKKNDQESRSLR